MTSNPEKPENVQNVDTLTPGVHVVDQYVQLFWSHRLMIVVGTLMFVLASSAATILAPDRFSARTTLLIISPPFSSDLRAPTLTISTYRPLIESTAMKLKVIEEVGRDKSGRLRLSDLSTEVYSDLMRGETVTPLVDLICVVGDPEMAKRVVQIWSSTVIKEIGGVMKNANKGLLDFIGREFHEAQERLQAEESQLLEAENSSRNSLEALENERDMTLAAFREEHNVSLLQLELEGLEQQLAHYSSSDATGADPGQRRVGLLLLLEELRYEEARLSAHLQQLSKEALSHPPITMLGKAISDEALWERLDLTSPSDSFDAAFERLKLWSQHINPIRQQLDQALAASRVSAGTLEPRISFVTNRIAGLRIEIEKLYTELIQSTSQLNILTRKYENKVQALKMKQEVKLGQTRRQVDSLRSSHEQLAQEFESSRLARSEEYTDIKVAAEATVEPEPVRPSLLLNIVLSSLGGFVLTCLAILVWNRLN